MVLCNIMSRSRRYCFTVNNPTDEDCESVHALSKYKHTVYLIVGTEVGEQGTTHLQCYVVFNEQMRFNRVKRLLPRAHIEVAKGSSSSNKVYCSKDGNFEEFGVCPADSGASATQKSKWDEARDLARAGDFDKIDSSMYIRYRGNFHQIHDDANAATACIPVLSNLWIYGDTGCGKSRYAWEHYPGAYRKGLNKWFCHYIKEPVVIIEDVDPSHFKWLGSFLKLWSDHYPFMAERKGGSRMIRPEKFVVTSNYRLRECLQDDAMLLPLLRRFEEKTVIDGLLCEIPDPNPPIRLLRLGNDHYGEA